jgi:hypothetical protein
MWDEKFDVMPASKVEDDALVIPASAWSHG